MYNRVERSICLYKTSDLADSYRSMKHDISESTVVLYVGMARIKNGHPYISIASDEPESLLKL